MSTLSAKTSNLLNPSKKKKIYLSSVLLILCAFFASWGAGLQNIASFDVSKIFVGFCILLILYWFVSAKHKFRAFPRSYNYFILYIILHTLIAYTIFVPEELGFGYLGESAARAEGFVSKQESNSVQIIRMFLFIFFAYAVASFVRTQKRLNAIAIAYGAGLSLSVFLGSYYHLSHTGVISQFAGGFLDPNFFGTAAFTGVWLNLCVVFAPNQHRYIRLLSLSLVSFSVLVLLSSISRGSMVALCVGVVCMVFFMPGVRKKLKIMSLICIIGIVVFIIIPNDVVEDIYARSNFETVRETGGSYRLAIWSEYLVQYPRYLLTGVGMRRSRVVIKDSTTFSTPRTTHNTYLETLVEFGIIGLLLFLLALWQLWRRFYRLRRAKRGRNIDAVFLGYFASWIMVNMFVGQYGLRSFWLSLGIISAYSSWGRTLLPLKKTGRLEGEEIA